MRVMVLFLLVGCVPAAKYNQLEVQYEEQLSANERLKMEIRKRDQRIRDRLAAFQELLQELRPLVESGMLELEVVESLNRLHRGVTVNDTLLAVDVIDEVGVGGEFLSHQHTLEHFRETMWLPRIWDHRNPDTLAVERTGDMLEAARQKVRDIWARDDLYRIDDDRAEAIDKVVARAEAVLRDA